MLVRCAKCKEDLPATKENFPPHKRKVRGLLCNRCNLGLGHFRDDPSLLEFARIYLLSSRGDKEAEDYIVTHGSAFSCEGVTT